MVSVRLLDADTGYNKELKSDVASRKQKNFSWLKSVEGAKSYRRSRINKVGK